MPHLTLEELGAAAGASPHGDRELIVKGICSVEHPRAGELAMAETAEHVAALRKGGVGAILHGPDLPVEGAGLSCAEPRVAFAKLLELFRPEPARPPGIHGTAIIDPRATVDPSAHIGPHCTIGPRASIGPGCFLQAFVSVAEDAVVGPDCHLYAHVVIGKESELQSDCRLEPWAQLGNGVKLGAGVDLGAHTALGNGVQVESGVKFDNLVVVGPRSKIGAMSLLVGQSSVDRDAILHSGVVLAGQSAVGPEAELVSGVQLGGRSWALGKLAPAGPYWGNPAVPLKQEMRRQVQERRNRSDA